MSRIVEFLGARLRTIALWIAVIVIVYGLVAFSRANFARQEAALASTQPDVRDDAVQTLVNRGSLADTLINTEDPNQDPTSPQNTRSLTMRQNAVDSVNRLAASKKISVDEAMETLFQLHKDSDSGVQGKATDGLTALAGVSDANLQKIVAHLSNGDPDIRGAAGDVLAKIGGDKGARAADSALLLPASADAASSTLIKIGEPSVPLFVAHLENPAQASDIAFRQQLLTILDKLVSPTAVPELVKLAGQAAQPAVQRQSQIVLADTVLAAYIGVQTARDAVTKAQAALAKAVGKDRDAATKAVSDAQTAGAKAEGALQSVQIAELPLRAVLSSATADSLARSQAALALGRFGSPGAIQVLVTALGDFDPRVREAALAGIQTAGAAAIPALTATLATGSPNARAAAAEALGSNGTPASRNSLENLLSNPASPTDIRRSAAIGLGRSGNAAAIPILVRALGDPDGSVESAASASLLSPALEKAAVRPLVAAFASPIPVPFNASQTLSLMGPLVQTDVVPALQSAIASGSPQTQTWAAVTLGQTNSKDPAIAASLQKLTQSKNAQVQYAATQALTQLSGS